MEHGQTLQGWESDTPDDTQRPVAAVRAVRGSVAGSLLLHGAVLAYLLWMAPALPLPAAVMPERAPVTPVTLVTLPAVAPTPPAPAPSPPVPAPPPTEPPAVTTQPPVTKSVPRPARRPTSPTKPAVQPVPPQPPAPDVAVPVASAPATGDPATVTSSPPGPPSAPEDNRSPTYRHHPKPPYPRISRARHEEGTVTLAMEITADGVPTAITIRKSSGFARLDQSAQTTVADWRFNPAQHMGAPVSSVLEINIVFRLTDEAAE